MGVVLRNVKYWACPGCNVKNIVAGELVSVALSTPPGIDRILVDGETQRIPMPDDAHRCPQCGYARDVALVEGC